MLGLQALEDAHQALGCDRRVDLDVQGLAVEIVDDVEGAKAPAVVERIGHEVGGPDRVGHVRHVQRHSFALGQAALGRPAQVQPHGLVHAIHPLVIPPMASPAQDLVALPEAAAGPVGDHFSGRAEHQWRMISNRR